MNVFNTVVARASRLRLVVFFYLCFSFPPNCSPIGDPCNAKEHGIILLVRAFSEGPGLLRLCFPFKVLCIKRLGLLVVGDFLLQDCFGDLCLFTLRSLAMDLDSRLVSTDSQVIGSSEVGSVVHPENLAFPVFDLMFKDVLNNCFENLDLLVQRGLGDGHYVVQLPTLALGTP